MPQPSQLSKYSVCKTLGQGSFGKALLVKLKGAKPQYFVMKEIQIGHLSKKEKETSIAEATGTFDLTCLSFDPPCIPLSL